MYLTSYLHDIVLLLVNLPRRRQSVGTIGCQKITASVLTVWRVTCAEPRIPEDMIIAVEEWQNLSHVRILGLSLRWIAPIGDCKLCQPNLAPTILLHSTRQLAIQRGHVAPVIMHGNVLDQRRIALLDNMRAVAKEFVHPRGVSILVPSVAGSRFTSRCNSWADECQRRIKHGRERLHIWPICSCVCWRRHVRMAVTIAIIGLVVSKQESDIQSLPTRLDIIRHFALRLVDAIDHGHKLSRNGFSITLAML